MAVGSVHPFLFGLFDKSHFLSKLRLSSPSVIALTAFIIYDLWLSAQAVERWQRRIHGQKAHRDNDTWLDRHFPNERMQKIYPSMVTSPRKIPIPDQTDSCGL